MKFLAMTAATAILILFSAAHAHAVASGVTITYEGTGAGAVVFSGTVHAKKGYKCADCHESHGLLLPWFSMKKGAEVITMRAMENGWSCGHCHVVSMSDMSSCSRCHRK